MSIEKDKLEAVVKTYLALKPNRETTKAICDAMIQDFCARKMFDELFKPANSKPMYKLTKMDESFDKFLKDIFKEGNNEKAN